MTQVIDAQGRIKRVYGVTDHTHAVTGDGGQLDWDTIWDDAAHDHSAAAEGGNALNLQSGRVDLDNDQDTSIRSSADGQIDFEVEAADTFIMTAAALRSQGSIFPTLGTTTLAEKLGHVYLGTAKDIYPGDDEAGLWERLNKWNTIATHFDGAAMPGGWSWAGAPFVTPDSASFGFNSILALGFGATQGTSRAFLYRTDDEDQTTKRMRVAPFSFADSSYSGVRMDDGSDTNYVESVLRKTAAADTYELVARSMTGGVGPTVTVLKTFSALPMFYEVVLQVWGTLWSSWGAGAQVGVDAPTVDAYVLVGGGLTWTCTRQGIVWYTSQATPDLWRGPNIDWYSYR